MIKRDYMSLRAMLKGSGAKVVFSFILPVRGRVLGRRKLIEQMNAWLPDCKGLRQGICLTITWLMLALPTWSGWPCVWKVSNKTIRGCSPLISHNAQLKVNWQSWHLEGHLTNDSLARCPLSWDSRDHRSSHECQSL